MDMFSGAQPDFKLFSQSYQTKLTLRGLCNGLFKCDIVNLYCATYLGRLKSTITFGSLPLI
jgi:hypothetical protein